MTTGKKKPSRKGISIGVFAVGMLTAALAGVLLAPKAGKKTQKQLKVILQGIQKDIAEQLSELKDITRETYDDVSDVVIHRYMQQKKITADQAASIRKDIKKGFRELQNFAKSTARSVQKNVKKNI